MTRPTRPQLDALAAALALPRGTIDRLWAHLERERRGGTVNPDGYPTATMGGSGTSGSGGDVVLTSVEAAVEVRLTGTQRDDHRAHTLGAQHCLTRAVALVDELLGHLRALDLADKVEDPTDGECRHHKATVGRDVRTGPSLRAKERALCDYCSDFTDKHGEPPPEVILERLAQGKRPTPQQIDMALGKGYGVTALGAKLAARLHR